MPKNEDKSSSSEENSCPQCGLTFPNRKTMMYHYKSDCTGMQPLSIFPKVILNEEQRFQCQKCNKSYKNKKHLDRHIKEECIDVLPRYQCNLCLTRFRRKYHLVRHSQNKHGLIHGVAQHFGRIDKMPY